MTDEKDVVGNEVYPLPVFVYGRSGCEGTQALRERLNELQVSFVELNVDEDEEAADYVRGVNQGEIRTPTVVFGNDEMVLVEPEVDVLDRALEEAGYQVNGGGNEAFT
jgi:mycoredoxin